jgi:bifunctional non-homologous end joining protein LigD
MADERTTVQIDDRTLSVSNLDKVLYPATGFTKGEVIDYYARVAPVMVPHLAGRCVTFRRFPNGVDGQTFFEKRCPKHRPAWVEVASGPGDGGDNIDYCLLEDRPALVWAANLAALELHTPMSLATDHDTPTMVVFDLDPGPGTGITECATVAVAIRALLGQLELEAWAKTSGSKGLQLYVPLNTPTDHDHASGLAHAVATLLEQQRPKEIVSKQDKSLRKDKVLIDWSQNSRHKTTVCVYSLRARPEPTVSTPVTWDEVSAAADGAPLRFEVADVLSRIDDHGDLFADVLTVEQHLPTVPDPD